MPFVQFEPLGFVVRVIGGVCQDISKHQLGYKLIEKSPLWQLAPENVEVICGWSIITSGVSIAKEKRCLMNYQSDTKPASKDSFCLP